MWFLLQWIERFKEYVVLILLSIIAFALMSLSDAVHLSHLRGVVIGGVAAVQQVVGSFPNPVGLENENAALRRISLQLMQQALRARQAVIENQQFRQLLQLKDAIPYPVKPAEVVGRIGVPGNLLFVLNVGRRDSVLPDMCVLSPDGVVGHIVEVTDHFAVVRSLLHRKTRIAGMLESTQYQGIVVWNNRQELHLENVSQSYPVDVGDRVVTSPVSTRYPPYLPIGVVQRVQDTPDRLDHVIQLAPLAAFDRLHWVGVVQWRMTTELQEIFQQYQDHP